MDTVKTITILDGDNSEVDYDGFCAYFSPQTAILERLRARGMEWYVIKKTSPIIKTA